MERLPSKKETAHATIHHLEFGVDDQLLLCTDGLTDMVSNEEVASELQLAVDVVEAEALLAAGQTTADSTLHFQSPLRRVPVLELYTSHGVAVARPPTAGCPV